MQVDGSTRVLKRLKEVLNKPREKLEIEDKRDQEKGWEVKKDQLLFRRRRSLVAELFDLCLHGLRLLYISDFRKGL